jgi:hypothetical protein
MNKHDKKQLLPGMLKESTWDTDRMSWLKRRDKIFWGVFAALTSFFVLWTYIGNWQSSSPWQKIFAVIYVPFTLWIILFVTRNDSRGWSQLRAGALALRQAAEEGDEQLAPLAAEQPAPLTGEALPIGPEHFAVRGFLPRHPSIVADELGLVSWRRAWGPRSRSTIYWSAARSFFVINYTGKKAESWHSFYALDAHDMLLFWHISYRTKASILAAHERLCRLIVTRTKLPLRDLSAAADKLASIEDNPSAQEQPLART